MEMCQRTMLYCLADYAITKKSAFPSRSLTFSQSSLSSIIYTVSQKIPRDFLLHAGQKRTDFGRHVIEGTLNKTKQKLPAVHVCASTTLGTWSDRLSRQRSSYMYILISHWIATKRSAVIVWKIVKHIVSRIILCESITLVYKLCFYINMM